MEESNVLERHTNPSDILLSDSLFSVHSHFVNPTENETDNILNSSESFKYVYRSSVNIRGASERKSRLQKVLYQQVERMEKDSISFQAESCAKCKWSLDESKWNVCTNDNNCSSEILKSNNKQAHFNSKSIYEESNFLHYVTFHLGIKETNDVLTVESRDLADVSNLSELAS
ncbi:hypothetical protein AVEN_92859-1 [Araneus ventricosus]|uniref:Uncharacterized protein n=1 Tax=Araneus ventricosus TaxID=182803 RepID=A0A4Y2NUJ5_ARAVE|nr:hypothetical protein AVEN_92859-1 [Araneus ventricosus]